MAMLPPPTVETRPPLVTSRKRAPAVIVTFLSLPVARTWLLSSRVTLPVPAMVMLPAVLRTSVPVLSRTSAPALSARLPAAVTSSVRLRDPVVLVTVTVPLVLWRPPVWTPPLPVTAMLPPAVYVLELVARMPPVAVSVRASVAVRLVLLDRSRLSPLSVMSFPVRATPALAVMSPVAITFRFALVLTLSCSVIALSLSRRTLPPMVPIPRTARSATVSTVISPAWVLIVPLTPPLRALAVREMAPPPVVWMVLALTRVSCPPVVTAMLPPVVRMALSLSSSVLPLAVIWMAAPVVATSSLKVTPPPVDWIVMAPPVLSTSSAVILPPAVSVMAPAMVATSLVRPSVPPAVMLRSPSFVNVETALPLAWLMFPPASTSILPDSMPRPLPITTSPLASTSSAVVRFEMLPSSVTLEPVLFRVTAPLAVVTAPTCSAPPAVAVTLPSTVVMAPPESKLSPPKAVSVTPPSVEVTRS